MNQKLYCLLLIIITGFSQPAFAASTPQATVVSYSDSLFVRIYSKGRILKTSPNPCINGQLKISVKSAVELHFYVFDLSGTLVHRATLNNKEKASLPVLEKGTYLYDIFENDLGIEEGRIVIK